MEKRKIDLLVLSDLHLGTYGCHGKELLQYLDQIEPGTVILNGDIIDIWQFKKRYWPASHMQVLRRLLKFAEKGIPVYYLTGNHDEMLRKFSDYRLGNLYLRDKLVLELDGKKAWFFHGDVFDVSMQYSKWLARLGGQGYDLLIILNRGVNLLLEKVGREKISLSKRIKDGVKTAVRFISDFEQIAADLAIERGYDYVVCGHIHQPVIKTMFAKEPGGNAHAGKSVTYLNSGDWIENLSALEYHLGQWSLYRYAPKAEIKSSIEAEIEERAPLSTPSRERLLPHPLLEEIFSLSSVGKARPSL
ncbi:MAG: UDP-2,3-diacylglucosamine diphosphatase [Bacteroidetes bacterium]|jgi:UDP-2,3-diacylglucosamine pyrophosphatase LpxH|nr:UDP-2,3-diacylglucosamine diphosphatase [Bacteroidota bacterium]NBY30911.1 UDP-2,3-diacylglucosamine diphosphatase [Sphingobacteriia bacterium]